MKRDAVGDIYVYLVCDTQLEQVKLRTGKSVGFGCGARRRHFGLAGLRKQLQFLTGSDGNDITSPYFFMQNIKSIRNKCRKLSRRKKGSHNRERYRKELARAYRRMDNQRRDFHFKTARKLCEEYACICLETLNMKGMARRWGRKIHSLGFSEFVRILEYEAMKFGTQIVFIDRWYPSSQLCHVCGYKNPEVKNLKVREWYCPSCGAHHNRERNAAINIHRAGTYLRPLARPACSGDIVRPASAGSVDYARIPCLC